MVGFRVVGKPEHAGLVLATFHQSKVGRRKQISSGFRHGSQNRLGGCFWCDSFNIQRARLIPNKSAMTLGLRQKSVKDRRISPLSSLSLLNQRANILT